MSTPLQLGKYAVSEVLGKGAMGIVYKGFDPHLRRTVALKTIRKDLIDDDQTAVLLARFRNEAQAAGQLSHPGIVSVYEWGEVDDIVFLAMEYVAGNSLREYFNRGTRFEGGDAVSMMVQLLDALNYAHEQGVWHRDIKPANMIIMNNGKLKIADFGIARIETSNLTQTGAIMGTPGYMAPEHYSGPSVDWRADIFSAGVVMYQLLTGVRPFTGSPESIAYKICHIEPVPAVRGRPRALLRAVRRRSDEGARQESRRALRHRGVFRDALLGGLRRAGQPCCIRGYGHQRADPALGAPGVIAFYAPVGRICAVTALRILSGDNAAGLDHRAAAGMGRRRAEADRAAARRASSVRSPRSWSNVPQPARPTSTGSTGLSPRTWRSDEERANFLAGRKQLQGVPEAGDGRSGDRRTGTWNRNDRAAHSRRDRAGDAAPCRLPRPDRQGGRETGGGTGDEPPPLPSASRREAHRPGRTRPVPARPRLRVSEAEDY